MGGQAQLGGVAPAFPAVVSRQHSEKKEPVSLGAALSPCLQTGGPSVPRLWHAHAPPPVYVLLSSCLFHLSSLPLGHSWLCTKPGPAHSSPPAPLCHCPACGPGVPGPGSGTRQGIRTALWGVGRVFPPNHRRSAPCLFSPSWEVAAGGGGQGKGRREEGRNQWARSHHLWAASPGRKEGRRARPRGWCRIPRPARRTPRERGRPRPRRAPARAGDSEARELPRTASQKGGSQKPAGREVRQRKPVASRLGPGEKQPAKQRIPSGSRSLASRAPHPPP